MRPERHTGGARRRGIDLAINPGNPDVVLAALWDKLRFPDGREYGGPGSGVHLSRDGGETWSRIGAPLPAAESEPGRIGVAFAASDPNRAYVITNDRVGNLTGFFVSDDAGTTWTRPMTGEPALDAADGGFAWWFGRLWVDPADANHVFSAGVPMMESNDGGRSWVQGRGIHVDQHALAWDPHNQGRVYVGNDGGLYWSDQNGNVTGAWTKASVQPYMQFYAMDASVQDVARVNGGTQDNGSLRSWGGPDWNLYRGGDGMMNRINPVDQNNVFGCSQNGGCARSDNGGDTMTSIRARFAGTRFNWVSPIEIAAGAPDTVYFGSNILNRSDDRGRTRRRSTTSSGTRGIAAGCTSGRTWACSSARTWAAAGSRSARASPWCPSPTCTSTPRPRRCSRRRSAAASSAPRSAVSRQAAEDRLRPQPRRLPSRLPAARRRGGGRGRPFTGVRVELVEVSRGDPDHVATRAR